MLPELSGHKERSAAPTPPWVTPKARETLHMSPGQVQILLSRLEIWKQVGQKGIHCVKDSVKKKKERQKERKNTSEIKNTAEQTLWRTLCLLSIKKRPLSCRSEMQQQIWKGQRLQILFQKHNSQNSTIAPLRAWVTHSQWNEITFIWLLKTIWDSWCWNRHQQRSSQMQKPSGELSHDLSRLFVWLTSDLQLRLHWDHKHEQRLHNFTGFLLSTKRISLTNTKSTYTCVLVFVWNRPTCSSSIKFLTSVCTGGARTVISRIECPVETKAISRHVLIYQTNMSGAYLAHIHLALSQLHANSKHPPQLYRHTQLHAHLPHPLGGESANSCSSAPASSSSSTCTHSVQTLQKQTHTHTQHTYQLHNIIKHY